MQLRVLAVSVGICLAFVSPAYSQRSATPPAKRFTKPAARVVAPAGVEADAHYERVLSNERVRVFRVSIAPNEATNLSAHPHDYIVVSLGKNEIEAVGDISTLPLVMNDGEVQIVTGGWPHKIVNKGAQPASFVTVEVLGGIAPAKSVCGLGTRACMRVRFGKNEDGTYSETPLFETEKVRLLRAELGPGGVLPPHTDEKDHLLLPTTQCRLADSLGAQAEQTPGQAIWTPERLSQIKNKGKEDARLLILEFK